MALICTLYSRKIKHQYFLNTNSLTRCLITSVSFHLQRYYYCHPQLTDDETEAQRARCVFSSEPHSYSLTESGFQHGSVSPKAQQVKEPQEMLSPFPLLSDPGTNHTDKGHMAQPSAPAPKGDNQVPDRRRERPQLSPLRGGLGKGNP